MEPPASRVSMEDEGGGVVDGYFWGTVSRALLVVLVGLLIVMVTGDVQRALEQRRHSS
jgi:hypothetical protein